MKFVLIMTLVTSYGSSIDHVEFNREDDCWQAAQSWVAVQSKKFSATAFCVVKR